MFVGKTDLIKSSGKRIHFKSKQARANWENVARAYKHGWKGPSSKSRKQAVSNAFALRHHK